MADRRLDLRGSVAVVTGAASGIGAGLARVLAERGCALALADRNAEGLAAVAEDARGRGVKVSEHTLDVADADAVAALPDAVLAGHGRVNVLVNNAGVALMGRFEQVSDADFEWLFGINFWGTVRMTRAFLPLLRREGASQIVNLSSVYGLMAPPGQAAYAASKFAVRGFSEALRNELEGSPVGVTVVHPDKLLRTEPDTAGALIARAIERRERRLLIGSDARQIAALVRMFPVGHWNVVQRLAASRIRRITARKAGRDARREAAHG